MSLVPTSAAQPQSVAKYVPVHRRAHDAVSRRSISPALSDASAATLVATEPHSPSKSAFSLSRMPSHDFLAPESRVYSITTLLHLAHDPEIKPISLVQREKIREVLPEIVMSRKMRKSLEFNAIQERLRIKALARPSGTPSKDVRVSASIPSGTSLPHQPQWQRSKARKQQNPNNAMEEVSWRTFRLPFVAV